MFVSTERLKSFPHFAGLGPAELNSIDKFVFEKTYGKGDVILFEDEPAGAMYCVSSGVVKVFKTSASGKEQTLNILRAGECFNDVPVFDNGSNPASAVTMTPVALFGIKKADFDVIMRRYPQVAINVTRILSQRVRDLLVLVEDLSFRHVIGRLAKILVEHVGNGQERGPRLTQQEMAAMAGTTREMIGRSLRILEEEGLIRFERHRLIIINQQALKTMANTCS